MTLSTTLTTPMSSPSSSSPISDPSATARDPASAAFLRFVRERDGELLEALLARHLDAASTQARRLLGSAADADDAVQEAVIALLRTAHRFDGRVPFAAWLGRLVHIAALRQRRGNARRRRRERVAATLPLSPSPDDDQRRERVREALLELPRRDQVALDLHYFSGLDQAGCASALGLSLSAASSRITRARARLTDRLQRRGEAVTAVALVQLLAGGPSSPATAALTAAVKLSIYQALASADAGAAGPLARAGRQLWQAVHGHPLIMAGCAAATAAAVAIGVHCAAGSPLRSPVAGSAPTALASLPPAVLAAAVADNQAPAAFWQGRARALLLDVDPGTDVQLGCDADDLRAALAQSGLATDPLLRPTWDRLRALAEHYGSVRGWPLLELLDDTHAVVIASSLNWKRYPDVRDAGSVVADVGAAAHALQQLVTHGGALAADGGIGRFTTYTVKDSTHLGLADQTIALATLEHLHGIAARELVPPAIPASWTATPFWLQLNTAGLLADHPDAHPQADDLFHALVPDPLQHAPTLRWSMAPSDHGLDSTLVITGVALPVLPLASRYAAVVAAGGQLALAAHVDPSWIARYLAADIERQLPPPIAALRLIDQLDGELAVVVANSQPLQGTLVFGITPGGTLTTALAQLLPALGAVTAVAGSARWTLPTPIGPVLIAVIGQDLVISNDPRHDHLLDLLAHGPAGQDQHGLLARVDAPALASTWLPDAYAALGLADHRIVLEDGLGSVLVHLALGAGARIVPGTQPADPDLQSALAQQLSADAAHDGDALVHQLGAHAAAVIPLSTSCFAHLDTATGDVAVLLALRLHEGYAVVRVAYSDHQRSITTYSSKFAELMTLEEVQRAVTAAGMSLYAGSALGDAREPADIPAIPILDRTCLPDVAALAIRLPAVEWRLSTGPTEVRLEETGMPLLCIGGAILLGMWPEATPPAEAHRAAPASF